MRPISKISSAAVFVAIFAVPAWAGPVGVGRTTEAQASSSQVEVNSELIVKLQEASEQDVRDGRNGNKNNPAYGQKAAEIDDLIARLESGQRVDPPEIHQALESVHIW